MLTVSYNRVDEVSKKSAGMLNAHLFSQHAVLGPCLAPTTI